MTSLKFDPTFSLGSIMSTVVVIVSVITFAMTMRSDIKSSEIAIEAHEEWNNVKINTNPLTTQLAP